MDFIVTFSEPVTGVDVSDFSLTTNQVTGAAVESVSGSDVVYTVTVSTGASNGGTLRLNVLDDDTIMDMGSLPLDGGFNGPTYTVYTMPLVISSVRTSANPTSADTVDFTVTFSKPVTGVDISDFVLTTTDSISGAAVESVSGSGDAYTVTVNTGSGSGTIRLDAVDDDTIVDAALRPLGGGFTSGEAYTIDRIAPTALSSVFVNANPISATFEVTFSESVTGVDVSDFTLTTDALGAVVSAVSGSGDAYTVTVNTGGGPGTIRLNVMENATITDIFSNLLAGGFTSGETYAIDNTTPTVLSSVVADSGIYNVNYIVTFSENVTGVDISDFTLTTDVAGVSISNVSGSGAVYTITTDVGIGSGTIRLDLVDDDTITDGVNPLGGTGTGNGDYITGETYLTSHTLTRVSVATDGTQGNHTYMESVSVSADGRYVAFYSNASNLVSGDTNGTSDVFVHDTQVNVTTRVSVTANGTQLNNGGGSPSISADGRYVTFTSNSSELVTWGIFGLTNVFVRDTQTNTTTLISVATDGTHGYANSFAPAISTDGRYVAFYSLANNLVSGDTNGQGDIFVRDTQTNTTTRVSVATNGTQANNDSYSESISMSADGRYIVFKSDASNLVSGDTNGRSDIFVRDAQLNATVRVSIATDGTQGNSWVYSASISADGRYVTLSSSSSNLVGGDTNGQIDIFVRDTQVNTTMRISLDTDGTQGNGNSGNPSISADGRYVVFQSNSSNLVNGDTNGQSDIFVRDTLMNTTTRISLALDGTQGNNLSGVGFEGISISANGGRVAFLSNASNLVDEDTNAEEDIFLYTGTVTIPLPDVFSIMRADSNPTNTASVDFVVTFSEVATSVDIADFVLTTTGSISGANIGAVSGSGDTYSVIVNTGLGNGDIRLDVVPTPLGGGFTSGEVYTIDKTPPTVLSIMRANSSPTNTASVNFTVTFSETVTGVDTSDFNLVTSGVYGSSVSGVSGTGNVYTVTVNTGSGDGTIRLDAADNDTIADTVSNPLNGGFTSGAAYTIDKTPPIILSITRADPNPTSATDVRFIVTFSEPLMRWPIKTYFSLTTTGISGAYIYSSYTGFPPSYYYVVNTGSGNGTIRLGTSSKAGYYILDLAGNRLAGLPYTAGETYTVYK